MTIIANHTDTTQPASLLTAHDVLDIERAISNVTYYNTIPGDEDRQALALAARWPGCKTVTAKLINGILDGTYQAPLNQRCTHLLYRLVWQLPDVSQADEDAYFATHVVAGATTPQADAAELLTAFDVLDIQCALNNAAAADTTELSPADRQALALLTYWNDFPSTARALISWLLSRLASPTHAASTLPLHPDTAAELLTLVDHLPAVSDVDVDAWLSAREVEMPTAAERVIATLVAYVAEHGNDIGSGHMRSMLNAALLSVSRPGDAPDEVVRAAREDCFDDAVRTAGTAARDMVAAFQRAKLTAADDANDNLAVAL